MAETVSDVIKLLALGLPKRHADSGPQQPPLGPLRRAGDGDEMVLVCS